MADTKEIYAGGKPAAEIRFAGAAESADGTWDASTQECWDAYAGSRRVWHKDKTVENCWVKYGLATDDTDTGTVVVDMHSVPEGKSGVLPAATDWQGRVFPAAGGGLKPLAWRGPIANTAFWDELREYIGAHDIDCTPGDGGTELRAGWFRGSNFTGDLTVNLAGESPYWTFADLFSGMDIGRLTIRFKGGGVQVSSMFGFFRGLSADSIDVIGPGGESEVGTTGTRHFLAYDLSAVCENARLRGEFPDFVDWSVRQSVEGAACTRMGYAFTQCGTVTAIAPRAGVERDDDGNTIRIAPMADQAFENCRSLASIGPVLDFGAVYNKPGSENSPGGGAYRTFAGCAALADVRIRNLNAGLWCFDDDAYAGNMPSLDAASVEYLIANLTDLSGGGADGVSTPSNNFLSEAWAATWVATAEGRTLSAMRQARRLPPTWPDYFLTTAAAVDMEVAVSGLQEGDRLEWGTGSSAPAKSDASITADGDYTLRSPGGATYGLRLYNDGIGDNSYYDDAAHPVVVTLKRPYVPGAAMGSAGTLYCPAEWDGKVTQEMVNAAAARGWAVYIGGELREPQDGPEAALVDAWIFGGHTNSEEPAEIPGEKGTALQCHNFAWTDGSGFGSGDNAGYLLTDGVDDYMDTTEGWPLLRNSDFTVLWRGGFTAYDKAQTLFIYTGDCCGVEYSAATGMLKLYSFGFAINADKGLMREVNAYTPTEFNGKALQRGGKTDTTAYKLTVGADRSHTGNGQARLAWMAFYDRTLTAEEAETETARLDALWRERSDTGGRVLQSLVLRYDPGEQGCTNESMAENPVLRDLSGNGHDAQCQNFAWAGMSGIGGYPFAEIYSDPADDSAAKLRYEASEDRSSVKVTGYAGDPANVALIWFRIVSAGEEYDYRIRISGLDAANAGHPESKIVVDSALTSSADYVSFDTDGEYRIQGTAREGTAYVGVRLYCKRLAIDAPITIEQLPLYPGGVVGDGVDDKVVAGALQATIGTIMAKVDEIKWDWGRMLFATLTGIPGRIYCFKENSAGMVMTGDPRVETPIDGGWIVYRRDPEAIDAEWLTLLTGSRSADYAVGAALYKFMLFDRSLTDEEIEWVKENM